MSVSGSMFTAIQGGRPMQARLWPAVVVYAVLAFLLINMKSVKEAAIVGAATYAVYDFTNLVTFKDYTLNFAIMDTVWGGVLFSTSYYILRAFWKKAPKTPRAFWEKAPKNPLL